MKYILVVAFAVLVCVAARPEDKYSTKYDGVDIDEILKSDRLFNNYYKCLMDKGKCTPDGSELKRHLPDALKTKCSKCSEKQRSGTDKVIKYLRENKVAQWESLQAKYDPEHVYIENLPK